MLKKMRLGGIVLASLLAATGCQNEEMATKNTASQIFSLEVSRGLGSRTTLEQEGNVFQAKWSVGDKIYVTSKDGKTTGVLTLDPTDAGSPNGTFTGFVFGNPEDLEYSVFPVPNNNIIDLNNPDEGQLDAPMVATINLEGTTQFTNACAMIMLDIDGLPENATVSVSNNNIVANASFNAETGKLTPIPTATTKVEVKGTKPNEPVYIPLFIKPNTTETVFDLTISVNNKVCTIEDIPLATEKLSHNEVPALQYTTVGEDTYLIKITEPTESEDTNDVLSEGGSVIITEEMETLTIGQSTDNVPTVITLDYEISEITINKNGDEIPSQPIKVIVAGGVTDQVKVTAEDGLNVELVYQVSDSQQMTTLFENLTDAMSGNTSVEVAANVNLSDIEWTPIKVDGYYGADIITIDGKGHVIEGLTAPLFAGGFAGGSGIVIKNWTIDQSTIVSTNTLGSGAFIESIDSMDKIWLENCHVKNSSITGGPGSRTGGLIGWTAGYNNENDGAVKTYVTIKDCSVIKCNITCDGSVGGLYGHAGNNAWTYSTVENCTVEGCTLNSTDDGGWRVGVVVGTANVGELTISNITESGNILKQTGKTAPAGQSNLYGRFVPGTTGKLIIDGEEIK